MIVRRLARASRPLALLAMLTVAPAVHAGDRLAVLVIAPDDPELSDRLTEVAIAAIAERSGRDLVGLAELRPLLPEIVGPDDVPDCLTTPACLSHLGRAAGAPTALVGKVRADGARKVVDIALVDTSNDATLAAVPGRPVDDVAALIAATQWGARAVLASPAALGAGVVAPPPGERAAGSIQGGQPAISLPAASPAMHAPASDPAARQKRLAAGLGYGAATLAVVAFGGAAVTGVVGRGAPEGQDRETAQRDLQRRAGYATASNWLWLAGGVLSGSAIAALTWRWTMTP